MTLILQACFPNMTMTTTYSKTYSESHSRCAVQNPPIPNKYFTVAELAAFAGVSVTTLFRKVRGQLDLGRIDGRSRIFSPEDVARFLALL